MNVFRRLTLFQIAVAMVGLQFAQPLRAGDAPAMHHAPRGPNVRGQTLLLECVQASGATDACELDFYRSLYEEMRANVDPQSLRSVALEDRLRILHQRLHSEILVGDYRKEASDMRLAIGRGDFNCLSATVLYWQLAQQAELELEIWSAPGHVYLSCPQIGRSVIEPAARIWPVEGVAQSASPPRARRVTPNQLVGKFYYNRGVQALECGEYAVGVELLQHSLMIDPRDNEAKTNLLAGLNNWAASLCRQERYAAAQSLIFQGLAIDGGFAPLVANERFVREKLSAP